MSPPKKQGTGYALVLQRVERRGHAAAAVGEHAAGVLVDRLDFGGLLGYAPVMPVNQYAGSVFAHRGGRMPAPLNSLKN